MVAKTTNRRLNSSADAEKDLLTTGQAAEVLGLSPDQFRRLGIEPDDTYVNRYHATCALYTVGKVQSLGDDPRVAAARERRRGTVDWRVRFLRQYGDREAALPDAARAMFELNRYAKDAGRETADRIYGLKNPLVKHLWSGGHCVAIHRHTVQHEEKECWGCEGLGCERCAYTGIWKPAEQVEFLCFRFEVHGKRFSWHQPARLAAWVPDAVIAEEPDADWQPGNGGLGDRPEMGFARAYALIEWVLEEGSEAGDPSGTEGGLAPVAIEERRVRVKPTTRYATE